MKKIAGLPIVTKLLALLGVLGVAAAAAAGIIMATKNATTDQTDMPDSEQMIQSLAPGWPSAFDVEDYIEPPFEDDPNRTNNAFNVMDFGEQGSNGWFYRYGKSKQPHRSKRITSFEGERYFQPGCNGLEIKSNFLHTSQEASPILEWRVAQDGAVNVALTYVKNVNGDKNPTYPDGVQLLVYKGEELLKLENVDISTTEERLAEIAIDDLDVKEGESLYFVVDPRSNNAFDGGGLYIGISDVNSFGPAMSSGKRTDNNANSVSDFGEQGSNGWQYLYGTSPEDVKMVSHEKDGEYLNCTSPNLSISSGFLHPSLNHNAVLGWTPAVNGDVDLRIRYTKFEQHDGNPDFPDGVKVRVYKNNELLYEQHVDAPAEGENKISHRIPKLAVKTTDRLYFMVDPEGNSSYDGGAFDVTMIDVRGATDEGDISVDWPETRQNFADVSVDFGPQGTNGWFYQFSCEDDPFHAYNMSPYYEGDDRYFDSSYLEIKRDYVNPGEHGRSPVIKWKVAQNGRVKIDASYTKMKNEDQNPDWPDGTRVSIYLNNTLLRQETFAPEVAQEVTKRLDVDSVSVSKGDYITMVINSLDNNAYDGGKYEFAISSISGLVGKTEDDVRPWYDGERSNFASTLDDFNGTQGHNGWYYQFGYYCNPFFAVNVERCENWEKYFTADGVEIKKDYIVPGNKGKSANVKWVAAEGGRINIDLEYTKLKNEDANPDWPDGVTVYLMRNKTVLRKQYFSPLTSREVTKSLAVDNVKVSKGDCITMIVDPGKNNAYDGGKYMFVIEDAAKTPKVKVGNWDNSTSLTGLASIDQGTDGWFFLEGINPRDAKVLTKKNPDGDSYGSRRTEGLEIRKDFVHTGATRDPIYQWVVGKNGTVDVVGTYVKFGQEDSNRSGPDGVTVKVWHNNKVLFTKKVDALRGDGNNNVIGFDLSKIAVKRGDKFSFQICADRNYAWDGGQLCAQIMPSTPLKVKPGKDNSTALADLSTMKQGNDGWYFLEGTSPARARKLVEKTSDGEGYVSLSTPSLEMKRDYVHTGAARDPIYMWVAAEKGKIDIDGSYVKFGQNDSDPNRPDGVVVTIWKNNTKLYTKQVKALRGEGKDNAVSFALEAVSVKPGDKLSFQIAAGKNNSWDAGSLSVAIEPTSTIKKVNKGDNSTSLSGLSDKLKQGEDGWYFLEGTSPAKSKLLTKHTDDGEGFVSKRTQGLEMKKSYVHTGATLDPIYQWIVAKDGKLDVAGSYVKFGQNDSNPKYPDGVTVTIWRNNNKLKSMKVKVLQGDGNNNTVGFSFDALAVKKGDQLSFQISADGNNAWDGGSLLVAIEPVSTMKKVNKDDNNTSLSGLGDSLNQGDDGWYFLEGTSPKKAKLLTQKTEDGQGFVSARTQGLEMKKSYVHTGATLDPIYQWIAAKDDKLDVAGTYVKFGQNSDNPKYPDGVTLTIWQNNNKLSTKKVKVLRGEGNDNTVSFNFSSLEVKRGDALSFQISADGNNSWDGGSLSVAIETATTMEKLPGDDNNTVLSKLDSVVQGNDGWYFLEGTALADAKPLTTLSEDKSTYKSGKDAALEMKKDYVHPGAVQNAIYQWVVKEDQDALDVQGKFVKFAHNDSDPNLPDGIVLTIWHNDTKLAQQKVKALKGDGNDNVYEFDFTGENSLNVSANDVLSFQISSNDNTAWDAGRLEVTIGQEPTLNLVPGDDNNTVLADSFSGTQGSDGWYYGICDWDGNGLELLLYDADNARYYNNGKPELKRDFVEPGNDKNAAYVWVAAEDGNIHITGKYVKFANSADPEANGTCVRIFLNGAEKKWLGGAIQGNFNTDQTVTFDETWEVKRGDILIFAVNPEGNDSYDGGRLEVTIAPAGEVPVETYEPGEDNNTNLQANFGPQGSDGWYYGVCDWDGANFTRLPYDEANSRYYQDGKPELKSDWAAATGGNAAYLWVAAADGKVKVDFKFTKTGGDKATVRCRIPSAEDDHYTEVTGIDAITVVDGTFEVKKGDKLIFQFEGDGAQGKPEVTITAVEESSQSEEYKPGEDNNTNLQTNFGPQGSDGWYYGHCDYNGENFTRLPYDEENRRYFEEGKPELKSDWAAATGGNAAYLWVAAADGKVKVDFKFTKTGGDKAVVRCRIPGTEGDHYTEVTGAEAVTIVDGTFEVKKGDKLIFQFEGDGAQGKPEVTISEETDTGSERTNSANLANDFSGEQGKNGWYYGMCDWDSKNFAELTYDSGNSRYYNSGKPELKADFVEPGNERNAAYKWVAAQDGNIRITGTYYKFANSDDTGADGTCVRIFLNGTEKKWMGSQTMGNFADERTESFDETYTVSAGDEVIFAVNPEGNDSYDGGRLEVTISPAT